MQAIENLFNEKNLSLEEKEYITLNFKQILSEVDNSLLSTFLKLVTTDNELRYNIYENIFLIFKEIEKLDSKEYIGIIYYLLNFNIEVCESINKNLYNILLNMNKVYFFEVSSMFVKYLGDDKKVKGIIDIIYEERKEEVIKGFFKYNLDKLYTMPCFDYNSGINDYTITLKYLIDEVLEIENLNFSDIKLIGNGSMTFAYSFNDIILKIGTPRGKYNIPNSKYILQPIMRKEFGSEYEFPFAYVELTNMVCNIGKVSEEELYELYKNLRNEGLIWWDIKFENVGMLLNDNKPYLKSEKYLVDQRVMGFDNNINETLKKDNFVLIDADFVSREDEPYKSFCSPLQPKFEARYQEEKKHIK